MLVKMRHINDCGAVMRDKATPVKAGLKTVSEVPNLELSVIMLLSKRFPKDTVIYFMSPSSRPFVNYLTELPSNTR